MPWIKALYKLQAISYNARPMNILLQASSWLIFPSSFSIPHFLLKDSSFLPIPQHFPSQKENLFCHPQSAQGCPRSLTLPSSPFELLSLSFELSASIRPLLRTSLMLRRAPATFFLTKRPIIGTHTMYGCKKKNCRCSVL